MAQTKIPPFVLKYFWGDNLEELNLENNQTYIIQTVLEKGDIETVKWLFSVVNRGQIKKSLPNLKMDQKSTNFWNIYLS